MLVILLLGMLAIVATGFGLFLSQRASPSGQMPRQHRSLSPKQRELAELFTARLRSGEIGIPDLIRLLRKEGKQPREINEALLAAMARFPKFQNRRDKFEAWLIEAGKDPL
jgi:hypothetical protein